MYVSHLIYRSLNNTYPKFRGDEKCVFCGKLAEDNIKKVIKKTFTGLPYLKQGGGVCAACEYCLTDRKKNSIRKMSAIFYEGGFLRFTALELADILFNFPKEVKIPFYFQLSYSKKKHTFYKGQLSFSKDEFFVQTDEEGFWFRPDEWRKVFELIQKLYSVPEKEKGKKNPKTYFTKDEILTLKVENLNKIIEFGADEFMQIKKRLEEVNKTPEYKMLVYAVRPKE